MASLVWVEEQIQTSKRKANQRAGMMSKAYTISAWYKILSCLCSATWAFSSAISAGVVVFWVSKASIHPSLFLNGYIITGSVSNTCEEEVKAAWRPSLTKQLFWLWNSPKKLSKWKFKFVYKCNNFFKNKINLYSKLFILNNFKINFNKFKIVYIYIL